MIAEHKSQEELLEMESFFIRHAEARKKLAKLASLQDQLVKVCRTRSATTAEDELAFCDDRAESLSSQMTSTSAHVRGDLAELRAENERLAQTAPCGSGYMAIRQCQHAALLRQFTVAMHDFQAIQREGQEEQKQAIARQLRIINPDADDEEIDAACDPTTSLMLRSSIFAIASKDKAQQVLEQMQARRKSMLAVEEEIGALSQLYNDMYMLLEEQQVVLDSLEGYLGGAVDYLDKAVADMGTAVEHQKNIRKMKCAIF